MSAGSLRLHYYLVMVVELLNKGLCGIFETSKRLVGRHVKLAVCRSLRRGGWISIISGVFESDTQISAFFTKYNITTTHLFHFAQAMLQCLSALYYTLDNVIWFVTLFLGMFQLLLEVFQAFAIALCLRKMQQNSMSDSDQINTAVGAVVFFVLDVDVMVRVRAKCGWRQLRYADVINASEKCSLWPHENPISYLHMYWRSESHILAL